MQFMFEGSVINSTFILLLFIFVIWNLEFLSWILKIIINHSHTFKTYFIEFLFTYIWDFCNYIQKFETISDNE